ncbi:ThiF family adenylyltransferase [Alteribacillus bidgolensis]|uniref:Molybdopterin or thiamine biosynthesis adenylyltransferase n=1 Tax=Alteribacillus bidgolensis TaxID=930129 RepID=A0A1G8QPF1_9BACI|nr:ThiF family adenylyltransferase [Alteribacillus bidgolensis]SDJ06541.1 Molybdopterin or thiamine biosynthesis adenylyltransferase [Alteribacillus bidgolensis]
MRLKFKETIPFFVLDNEIQIGEEEGVAGFLEDPDGSVKLLVENLDGSKDIEEIIHLVQKQYPNISDEEITNALEVLANEGYLENASLEPKLLTSYELERYKANINYFSLFTSYKENKFAIQEKINQTPISLLGVGGLGTQILYHLSALGFHNIKALDFDHIELSNFNRQLLYSEKDIGKNKIEMAKKRIAEFNPNVNLETTNKKIESTQDVINHIEGTELVICVADKPTLHLLNWVNEAVVTCNVPLVSGGILNTRGRFFSMVPKETGCIQCHIDYARKINQKQNDQFEAMRNIDYQRKNAAISPNVAILAGTLVNEAIKILTGMGESLSIGKVMEINFMNLEKKLVSRWEKLEECPVCGDKTFTYA